MSAGPDGGGDRLHHEPSDGGTAQPAVMRFSTETDRVEAFSDGVLAVIITIMVLELRPPEGSELRAVLPALPNIATYALSFVLVGIYWNNHHHMLRASRGVDG